MSGIEFTNNPLPGPNGPHGKMSRPAQPEETQAQPTSSTHAGETQAGGNVSSWHEKLQDLPEVRPEMVIKGKQLLQQSEYPDRSQIENLASRLLGER